MSVGLVPSGGSEGETVPCVSPRFWWLLRVLDVPGLIDASLPSLLLSSHGILFL